MRRSLGLSVLSFDLCYSVGKIVKVGAEGIEQPGDGAPARVAPAALDVGHIRLAGAHAVGECLLSEPCGITQRTHGAAKEAGVVDGAGGHRSVFVYLRYQVCCGRVRHNNKWRPRCSNTRAPGTEDQGFGTQATIPSRLHASARGLRCLRPRRNRR